MRALCLPTKLPRGTCAPVPVLLLLSLFFTVPGIAQGVDPNATIFYNVIKGCTNKYPSWNVSNPLPHWAGAYNCPGPNCGFILTWGLCSGPLDFTALQAFNYFSSLRFTNVNVTGTVDLTQLPSNLTDFSLNGNALTGPVDLTQLPRTLQTLALSGNGLQGTVDLLQLPATLRSLDLSLNSFSGTPDLSRWLVVQGSELILRLNNNSFTGTVSVNVSGWNGQKFYLTSLSGNPLFAVWMVEPDVRVGGIYVPSDPSVRRYTTTNATKPLNAGVFVSSATTHALGLSASGTATLGSCNASVPSGSFEVFTDGSNYVADSGVIAAALAPCLPTTFGTPQYFLRPTSDRLVLVTSGAQNITLCRGAICAPCTASSCDGHGNVSGSVEIGCTCSCNSGYSGAQCNACASGYIGYPDCQVQTNQPTTKHPTTNRPGPSGAGAASPDGMSAGGIAAAVVIPILVVAVVVGLLVRRARSARLIDYQPVAEARPEAANSGKSQQLV